MILSQSLFQKLNYHVCVHDEVLLLIVLIWCVWSVSSEQRCELNCRAIGFRFYVRQADRVIDGTPCGQNQTSVCVAGKCQVGIRYLMQYFASRSDIAFFLMSSVLAAHFFI